MASDVLEVGRLSWRERRRLNRLADRTLRELDADLADLLDRYGLSADALEREVERGGESFEPRSGDDWRGF